MFSKKATKIDKIFAVNLTLTKGQIIWKGLLVSSNSHKKRTNEFIFTTTMNLIVCFLGEFEDTYCQRVLSKLSDLYIMSIWQWRFWQFLWLEFSLNSPLRTLKILKNDVQMLILSLSYFITVVPQIKPHPNSYQYP